MFENMIILGQGNVCYFKRCSFPQINLVRLVLRLIWWRESLGELEHLGLQNQHLFLSSNYKLQVLDRPMFTLGSVEGYKKNSNKEKA